MTTHVAAALETARAAELAVAVRSATRERDIAVTMRDAVTYLSGALDPADVLRRLHATVGRALPNSQSWLAVVDEGKLHVWDEHDDPAPVGPDVRREAETPADRWRRSQTTCRRPRRLTTSRARLPFSRQEQLDRAVS